MSKPGNFDPTRPSTAPPGVRRAVGEISLALAMEVLARSTAALYRHTAAVFHRQRPAGPPKIDDAAALAEVQRLVDEGRKPWTACMIVARRLAGPAHVESVARRLYRKFLTH